MRLTILPSSRYTFRFVFPGTIAPVTGSGITTGASADSTWKLNVGASAIPAGFFA